MILIFYRRSFGRQRFSVKVNFVRNSVSQDPCGEYFARNRPTLNSVAEKYSTKNCKIQNADAPIRRLVMRKNSANHLKKSFLWRLYRRRVQQVGEHMLPVPEQQNSECTTQLIPEFFTAGKFFITETHIQWIS